jgi:hypothetical protein
VYPVMGRGFLRRVINLDGETRKKSPDPGQKKVTGDRAAASASYPGCGASQPAERARGSAGSGVPIHAAVAASPGHPELRVTGPEHP